MMREQIYCMEQISYGEKLGMTGILRIANHGFDDFVMLFVDFDDWFDYVRQHLTSTTTSVLIRRIV